MKTIKKIRKKILKNINEQWEKLRILQLECSHENATKKYCGDTGNFDPADNIYWIEIKCPDCGLMWTEDQ